MKSIAFSLLVLTGCAALNPKAEASKILCLTPCTTQEGVKGVFSPKHVDIAEARRMMAAWLVLLPNEKDALIMFEPMDGYVERVSFDGRGIEYYIWSDEKGRRIKVLREPFEGVFDKSFGRISPDAVPFSVSI